MREEEERESAWRGVLFAVSQSARREGTAGSSEASRQKRSASFEIGGEARAGSVAARDALRSSLTFSVPPQLMSTMDLFCPSLGSLSPRFWSSWYAPTGYALNGMPSLHIMLFKMRNAQHESTSAVET